MQSFFASLIQSCAASEERRGELGGRPDRSAEEAPLPRAERFFVPLSSPLESAAETAPESAIPDLCAAREKNRGLT